MNGRLDERGLCTEGRAIARLRGFGWPARVKCLMSNERVGLGLHYSALAESVRTALILGGG